MGFPIRKSADQSLFAAPHGLSQRTTSFIASQRQGIHRIPLRHLIALIIDAHRSAAALFPFEIRFASIERPVCFKHIRERCGHAAPTCWLLVFISNVPVRSKRSDAFPFHDDRQHAFRQRVEMRNLFQGRLRRRLRRSAHLVEPDGIEPTTSCLQSTRSPN